MASDRAAAGGARRVDGGGRVGLCAGAGRPRRERLLRDQPRASRVLRPQDVTTAGVCRPAAPRSRSPRALPALPALPARLLRRAIPSERS